MQRTNSRCKGPETGTCSGSPRECKEVTSWISKRFRMKKDRTNDTIVSCPALCQAPSVDYASDPVFIGRNYYYPHFIDRKLVQTLYNLPKVMDNLARYARIQTDLSAVRAHVFNKLP